MEKGAVCIAGSPEGYKKADLGEESSFYYNKGLGRWVERGKEAEGAAEDVPLPPPPTGPPPPPVSPSGSALTSGIGGVANRYALPPSFSKSGPASGGRPSSVVAPPITSATGYQLAAGLPMGSNPSGISPGSLRAGGAVDCSVQDAKAPARTYEVSSLSQGQGRLPGPGKHQERMTAPACFGSGTEAGSFQAATAYTSTLLQDDLLEEERLL
jgi:hypothetical protein